MTRRYAQNVRVSSGALHLLKDLVLSVMLKVLHYIMLHKLTCSENKIKLLSKSTYVVILSAAQ
jgi:hypothetical protein